MKQLEKLATVLPSFSKMVFICVFNVFLFTVFSCSFSHMDEYTYNGTVISHGYEPPSSGYKSSQDAKYFIYMREDVSGKVIRINVTIPDYHRLKDGGRASFTLSNRMLYRFGNTVNMNKNLYEQ